MVTSGNIVTLSPMAGSSLRGRDRGNQPADFPNETEQFRSGCTDKKSVVGRATSLKAMAAFLGSDRLRPDV